MKNLIKIQHKKFIFCWNLASHLLSFYLHILLTVHLALPLMLPQSPNPMFSKGGSSRGSGGLWCRASNLLIDGSHLCWVTCVFVFMIVLILLSGRDYHNVAQFGGGWGHHNVAQFGKQADDKVDTGYYVKRD